jgi:hypothetical protein
MGQRITLVSKQKRPKHRSHHKIIEAKKPIAIAVPKGHVPLLAVHPEAGLLEIFPVPRKALKEKSWWDKFVDWASPAQ